MGASAASRTSTAAASSSRGSCPRRCSIFVVDDAKAEGVVAAIAAAAHSGNESGDGLVWTTPIENVTHNRTGLRLEEVEVG